VIDTMKILDLIKKIKVADEKQIGGDFGSICIIPCHRRRRINIFIAESEKVRTARLYPYATYLETDASAAMPCTEDLP
jgi:hypothetical protein